MGRPLKDFGDRCSFCGKQSGEFKNRAGFTAHIRHHRGMAQKQLPSLIVPQMPSLPEERAADLLMDALLRKMEGLKRDLAAALVKNGELELEAAQMRDSVNTSNLHKRRFSLDRLEGVISR
jgi:hypothetical protein